ncbi:hypothetical protein KY366_07315 [Candidatus Woesearchaeota archaeon]|nr:hypothetical protein [Candidatus Woesearchaeota archaeon]
MKEFEKKIIELFQEMGHGQGMNDELLMTLFAKLYMSPEPVAMDDLAAETGYSLASISSKAKMLGPLLNIKRVRKPGSKKLFLYMEKDILSVWKDILLKKQEHVINKVREKLPSILKEYKGRARTDEDKKRLSIIESYYEQVLKFGAVLKKCIIELEKAG